MTFLAVDCLEFSQNICQEQKRLVPISVAIMKAESSYSHARETEDSLLLMSEFVLINEKLDLSKFTKSNVIMPVRPMSIL